MSKRPARRHQVERIAIVIEEIDGRWFLQIDGGDIVGGYAQRSSIYVALSDHFIAMARRLNPEAMGQVR